MYLSSGAIVVPHRRRPVRTHRRLRLLLLLAGLGASPLAADETGVAADGPGLTLQAPLNSTFQLGPPKRSWEAETPPAGEAEAKTAALPAVEKGASAGNPSLLRGEASPSAEEKDRPAGEKGQPAIGGNAADETSGSANREVTPSGARERRLAIPRFASPTAVPRSGRSVATAPKAAPPAQDGWVAREAIGEKAPLRDPQPAVASATPLASGSADAADESVADESVANESVPDKSVAAKAPEQGTRSARGEAGLRSEAEPIGSGLRDEETLSPATPPSLRPVDQERWQSREGAEAGRGLKRPARLEAAPGRLDATPDRQKAAPDRQDAASDRPEEAPERPEAKRPRETDAGERTTPSLNGPTAGTPRTAMRPEGSDTTERPPSDEAFLSSPKANPAKADATKANPAKPNAADEPIEVRSLRVGQDGSLAGESTRSRGSAGRRATSGRRETSGPAASSVRPEGSGAATARPASRVRRDYTGHVSGPIDLDDSVRRMEPAVRRCLEYYFARPENAGSRSNWGLMHSIMVYGVDTQVIAGRDRHNAIAWIAGNNACRGHRLLAAGPDGIRATEGVGLQGHPGQFLAVIGMVGVPADYPLYAGRSKHSVQTLVDAEARACRSGNELTFSLIGLAHYMDTDQTWVASDGQRWDFERMIREELSESIVGAACGGTHRLMGFAHALRKRRAEGRPIDGQWARAENFLRDFVDYTYTLQNRDGSFSTNWFEGREDNGDLDRKIQTTGHMVEWLLTVTPDHELQNPRLLSAVRFLVTSMTNQRTRDWAIGPKGHALRSLAMFYDRAYGSGPAWKRPSTARSGTSGRR